LKKWERPDGSIMGIVGDFETGAMVKEVQEVLGDWERAPDQPSEAPRVCQLIHFGGGSGNDRWNGEGADPRSRMGKASAGFG
jgi:hypothetical protein